MAPEGVRIHCGVVQKALYCMKCGQLGQIRRLTISGFRIQSGDTRLCARENVPHGCLGVLIGH